MVALTYAVGRLAAKRGIETSTVVKDAFHRFMKSLIESREQHARREIARHLRHFPHALDKNGNVILKDLPFGGV